MGKKKKVKNSDREKKNICINRDCKIRKVGCVGAKNCPGYKSKNEE